jgi:hypothetical protein
MRPAADLKRPARPSLRGDQPQINPDLRWLLWVIASAGVGVIMVLVAAYWLELI